MKTSAAALVSDRWNACKAYHPKQAPAGRLRSPDPGIKVSCVFPSLEHAAFFNKELSSFATHILSAWWSSVNSQQFFSWQWFSLSLSSLPGSLFSSFTLLLAAPPRVSCQHCHCAVICLPVWKSVVISKENLGSKGWRDQKTLMQCLAQWPPVLQSLRPQDLTACCVGRC